MVFKDRFLVSSKEQPQQLPPRVISGQRIPVKGKRRKTGWKGREREVKKKISGHRITRNHEITGSDEQSLQGDCVSASTRRKRKKKKKNSPSLYGSRCGGGCFLPGFVAEEIYPSPNRLCHGVGVALADAERRDGETDIDRFPGKAAKKKVIQLDPK